MHFVEHHRAHLASAFFASPFEEAAVISIDGFGDFSSVMWGMGKGNQIEVRDSVSFPHSLGIFYTAFTQFLGFPKYGDEYKMMGLSAYGEPRFAEQVRRVVHTEGGSVPSQPGLLHPSHQRRGDDLVRRENQSWVRCFRRGWWRSLATRAPLGRRSNKGTWTWRLLCNWCWRRIISPC